MSRLITPKLIQRLSKPTGQAIGFGRSGAGFHREAIKLLNSVISFEYMGSSEFEFGAVPDAFGKLLESVRNESLGSKEITMEGLNPTYFLADKSITRDVELYLNDLAQEKVRTYEPTNYSEALKPSYQGNTVGWVELDNPFMFFTDKEMFTKIKNIYLLK